MAAWHINAVRVPLNEDCWLGINNAPSAYSGNAYRSAIAGYVSRLHAAGMVAILDLHWTAAGGNQSNGQQDMPDADHATAFWTSVASTFQADSSTVFDLFNEPHDVSWACWRDGGDCGVGFQVAGMQTLVNAVRATGATNPVLVGGLAYANDLSSWLAFRPTDPTGNLMASWHSYNFNTCSTASCWDSQVAPVAAAVPLVTGEVGENDCAHGYLDALLPWLDGHGAGYLGWGWDTYDCAGFPALVSDYSGTPTNFGVGLRDHLAQLAGASPSPSPTTTPTTAPPSTAPSTTAPSTTAPPTAAPPTTAPTPSSSSGPVTLTVVPSAQTASAPWWWEEDADLSPSAAVTSLTLRITVARTIGIGFSGLYSTAPGGALTLSETTGRSAITYRATLNSGQTLAAGAVLRVGAQFGGTGAVHAISGDTYRVTATVGGRKVTLSGHF